MATTSVLLQPWSFVRHPQCLAHAMPAAPCSTQQRFLGRKKSAVLAYGKSGISSSSGIRQQRHSTACRAASNGAGAEYVEADGFRIEKISFGSILTPIGLFFLTYGFGAFFQVLPGADIAAILLIYGFPITLLGFALSYAQLKPVPCRTTAEALRLRDAQATDIQKQLREDVTRYRYGDEQHLDEALTRIFQFGRQQGIPRRLTPVLRGVREEAREGAYTLVLEFETKEQMTFDMWESRLGKIQSFFGPGVNAEVNKVDGGVDVFLITDGSGAGRGGGEQKDVLPPLMPGLKARQQ